MRYVALLTAIIGLTSLAVAEEPSDRKALEQMIQQYEEQAPLPVATKRELLAQIAELETELAATKAILASTKEALASCQEAE